MGAESQRAVLSSNGESYLTASGNLLDRIGTATGIFVDLAILQEGLPIDACQRSRAVMWVNTGRGVPAGMYGGILHQS